MDKITCLICNKLIPTGDLVYGESGEYYCDKCFDNTPPEKPLTRNQLFAENKREFYSSRRAWNNKANESLSAIVNRFK